MFGPSSSKAMSESTKTKDPGQAASRVHAPVEPGCRLDCVCGNLLARRVPGGIELKCRRCKRVTVVALTEEAVIDGLDM